MGNDPQGHQRDLELIVCRQVWGAKRLEPHIRSCWRKRESGVDTGKWRKREILQFDRKIESMMKRK